jgi:hypothetical protein
MANVVRYGSRTFSEVKEDLIALIRQQYPDVLSDFTDSSVGSMLIDLNAGVSNSLSVNTDRAFQETQLEYAQKRNSILNIAKNLGFNIPARRPSVTVVDFTVTVPVSGDRPDASYYPTLAAGSQVIGGGKIFEIQDTIDWNSPISTLGDPNRSIIPNLDANGIIVSYNVTKREVVVNGSTNIFKRVITSENVRPFFSIILPDSDVIDIEGVILKEGTNFSTDPSISEFNPAMDGQEGILHYYEVDYLAQQNVFIENPSAPINSGSQQNHDGLRAARWERVTKKFIREFTPNGFCKLTFGSGDAESDPFEEGLLKEGITNRQFLQNFLNNTALGEQLRANYTLFVRYRTGGGVNSNIGAETITSLGAFTLNVNGSRQDLNQQVRRSLTVNNPIPAMGGNDGLSIEQIRQLIKYNFSSQNRSVTLTDYLLQVYKMPGEFGSPFRANAYKENNKVVIPILSINAEGKLSNTSNSLLKENLTEYLSGYRMLNDYVEVKDGQIFNLAFDIDVYVQNISDTTIANNIITIVRDYFDINKYEMNTDIFLGQLESKILEANGVINIIDIKVYNRVGGQYSNNTISQSILDTGTGEKCQYSSHIYLYQNNPLQS